MWDILGIHLATGEQDIGRITKLRFRHYLALQNQADYLAQCPGEKYLRLWHFAHEPLVDIARDCRYWRERGFRHLIPWNEANLESQIGYGEMCQKFLALCDMLKDTDIILHWPALHPGNLYRELVHDWYAAAAMAPILDVHCYGTSDEMLEIVDWYLTTFPQSQLLITEYNFGAGREVNPEQYALDVVRFLKALETRPRVIGAIGFIWKWYNPDIPLKTTLDWIDQPIERVMREINMGVDLAVAVFGSTQAYNSYAGRDDTEYSAMCYFADLTADTLVKAGVNAKAFRPAAPDLSSASVAQLLLQQDAGHKWLAEQTQVTKIAINYHSDSGKNFSHTFGIFPRRFPLAKELAILLGGVTFRTLGTNEFRVFDKLGSNDYNTYIFATHALAPAVLLELFSHETKQDLDSMWERSGLLAEEITKALVAWVQGTIVDGWKEKYDALNSRYIALVKRADMNLAYATQARKMLQNVQ